MPNPSEPNSSSTDAEVSRQLGRMTRRGLAIGGSAILAGLAARRWLFAQPTEGDVIWPLRRTFQLDERISRATFDPSRLAPTFDPAKARMPRTNGRYGLDLDLVPDLDAYRLKVEGPGGSRSFTLAEIKALPKHEMTTELKCIEGWSTIVHWGGARLADLAARTGLASRDPARPLAGACDFASLESPGRAYYVGLEILAALHPQTLLCYEMEGAPLTPNHGAPLRLAIPLKYGIKSIKNLASIRFTDRRPADFWADRGYDWYSGH